MNAHIKAQGFTEQFDKYVCEGDTITAEVDGIVYTAQIEYDLGSHIDDDDCHNTDQAVTGCNDEQQERLLAARQAWFEDEWFYCGVVIRATKNGIVIDKHAASLWSIEANYPDSDNSYLSEVANELLPEAIEQARQSLARTIKQLTG